VEAVARQVKRENDGGAETRLRVIFRFGEQQGTDNKVINYLQIYSSENIFMVQDLGKFVNMSVACDVSLRSFF